MNWIEVIGPSGVGKSTFLNLLKKHRKKNAKWLKLDEALLELYKANLKNTGIKQRLIDLYLGQNFIDFLKMDLVKQSINKKECYHLKGRYYNHLIKSYLDYHYLDSNKAAYDKAYRIHVYRSIIETLTIFDFFKYQKHVFLEEGPFNHNPNLNQVNWTDNLEKPSCVIFCTSDSERIFQRIQGRAKKNNGVRTAIHIGLSEKDIRNKIEISKKIKLNQQKIVEELEIPYKVIDLSNYPSLNLINDVNDFIEKSISN